MSQLTATAPQTTTTGFTDTRRTRTLLACGALAGPFYVTVAAAQVATRDGFDIRHHAVSLLSNGDLGWIQITNFVVTGLLTVAGAIGLRRALRGGRGATWAPRLIGVYGASLVAAGALVADPAGGFPAGSPAVPQTMSWHGLGHLVAGSVGFLALIAACAVIARRALAEGRRGWALASAATGVLFWAAFAGVASGVQAPALNLAFTAAVVAAWAWLTTLMTLSSGDLR